MSASLWEPVLAGVGTFLVLTMAGLLLTGFLLWRVVRRKWQAFHAHGAVVGATALWEAVAVRRRRGGEPTTADEVGRWSAGRTRKELWRAVDRAEAAVRTANEADAPTGELAGLCRRLREAAAALDRVLRVEPAGPVPTELRSQVHELIRAAGDVQRAAVISASDANGHRVRDLTRDAVDELRLLDAGLTSARSALPVHPGD